MPMTPAVAEAIDRILLSQNEGSEVLDSVSRRQLWAIVGISSLLSIVFNGLDVTFTVFSVSELDLPASDLALLRSLRLIVTVPFILVMGGISDSLGQKKTAAGAIALTAAAAVLTVAFPGKRTLYATFPVYGGLVSILLVSMNVLSQGVRDDLRGLSNTLYRSTYAGFAIAGLGTGFLIRKFLAKLMSVPYLLSAACNLAAGLQSNVWITVALFILSTAFYAVTMAPTSLWLGEMSKQNYGKVFGLFKIVSAGTGFLVSAALSAAQPLLGVDLSLVVCGAIGVLASLMFMRQISRWKASRHRGNPQEMTIND